jgi:hypothetical protein
VRPITRDRHLLAEPLASLVVQIERAQPLAEREVMRLIAELDLDPELVLCQLRSFRPVTRSAEPYIRPAGGGDAEAVVRVFERGPAASR